MGSSWLVGGLIALAVLVFLYTPGPGRQLRHWVLGRFWWKVRQSGRALVNVRVVAGTQEGLPGRRWFGGTALATPGRIEFTMWVGGLPLVRRPIPAIEVTSVGAAGPVRGLTKLKLMDPDYQVAQLRTPTATLEIAVSPPVPAEDVLARLRVPDMPTI
jgi:hypothetical protein